MASATHFLLALFPLSIPYFFLQSSLFVSADQELIQKTCQGTKYPDLCISTIQYDPSSSTADKKGLAVIVLHNATATATATFMYLSNEGAKNGTSPEFQRVIKYCTDKYGYARNALDGSLQDIASDQYDDAALEASAAVEYPKSCYDEFTMRSGLTYPVELAQREEVLEHLCEVAVGILSLLS